MTAPEQIDWFVSTVAAPLLKAKGFKRRRLGFSRPFTHGHDVLVFQKSSWNTSEHAKFTVNLGIYWSRAQELLGRSIVGVPFSDGDCTVFRRIGHIMPGRTDEWWSVRDEFPMDVRDEVLTAIEEFALPWFERLHEIRHSLAAVEEYRLIDYINALKTVKHELAA
jgi:hypothetical protein